MFSILSNTRPRRSEIFNDGWPRRFEKSPSDLVADDYDSPLVNVREEENASIIEVAIPGTAREDFSVEIDDDLLIVKSEKEFSEDDSTYTRREFSVQRFYRSFRVNSKYYDLSKIDATYKDGLLSITLPKTDMAITKSPRQITIS